MQGMDSVTGKPLADMAHIRQSITNILTTPIGTRVMRRDYGSVLPDLIDRPLNGKTVLRVYAAAVMALMKWEPRLKISRVQLISRQEASAMLEVIGTVGDQLFTHNVQLRN